MPAGAYSPLFPDDLFSAAFADQTAFDEEHSSPTWEVLETTRPEFSFDREIEDMGLSTSGDFSKPARKVGARSGTVSFSVPLRSQLSTYDPSAGSPVINPEIKLLKEIIGASAIGTYGAAGIGVGSAANSWKSAETPGVGEFYMVGDGSAGGTIDAHGWVTDQDGTDISLFEDGIAIPANGDDVIQAITLYPASPNNQPTAKTFRLKGEQGEHDIRVIGCMPESVTIDLKAGSVPTATFNYRFTDWKYETGAGDGLLTSDAYQRLPPILGVHSGRVWLGGSAESDGTAETDGTCGLGSLQLEITCSLKKLDCHGAAQGTANLFVNRRMAKMTFTAPMVDELLDGERSIFDKSLEDDFAYSLSVVVGDTVGQVLAILMPAGLVVNQVSPGSVEDGYMGWTVEMEADAYAGDGSAAGNAKNTDFRMAFG